MPATEVDITAELSRSVRPLTDWTPSRTSSSSVYLLPGVKRTAAFCSVKRASSRLPQNKSAKEQISGKTDSWPLFCREMVPGLCSARSVYCGSHSKKSRLHCSRRRMHPRLRHPRSAHALTLHDTGPLRAAQSPDVYSVSPHYNTSNFVLALPLPRCSTAKGATFSKNHRCGVA